jgi:hypothetical protein
MEQFKYHSRAFPTRLCTDTKFKYRNAAQTDVRRTWRKARLLMLLAKGNPYESLT